MTINIILLNPEIPQNTGNIIRTCAVTGAELHLVGKKGFSLEDKHLRRAGLDYHDITHVHEWETFEEVMQELSESTFYFLSKKATSHHTTFDYPENVTLVFGCESLGLPDSLLAKFPEQTIRIPMIMNKKARSLNLANSVSIILYEVLRQHDFPQLI
jgi:tRNA (cytidine/uridine-2'-O-)-methyltransferase